MRIGWRFEQCWLTEEPLAKQVKYLCNHIILVNLGEGLKEHSRSFRISLFWEGDWNTKFFHRRATERLRKNCIKGRHFNQDGVGFNTNSKRGNTLHQYFQNLFAHEYVFFHFWPNFEVHKVHNQYFSSLYALPTEEEVNKGIQEMAQWKAPDLDGMPVGFYQSF